MEMSALLSALNSVQVMYLSHVSKVICHSRHQIYTENWWGVCAGGRGCSAGVIP